jgi:hypothetical protein
MQLPVSGMALSLRSPDGCDDLAILEARGPAVARALAVLPRLAQLVPGATGHTPEWESMTVTDFEVALLALRERLFGQSIACALDCSQPECGQRVEMEFRVEDFVNSVRPHRPRDVQDDARPGWFRLEDTEVVFRLPTVGDQAAVAGSARAGRDLEELCIKPPGLLARLRARVERAMEQLAPEVSRPIAGQCPHCGQGLSALLYVPVLVLDELRRAAVGIYEEVHLIASAYHWSEDSILALPRARRWGYAERVRAQNRARA